MNEVFWYAKDGQTIPEVEEARKQFPRVHFKQGDSTFVGKLPVIRILFDGTLRHVLEGKQQIRYLADILGSAEALAHWNEKLIHLHSANAISADPESKYNLRKAIEEANQKISELEAKIAAIQATLAAVTIQPEGPIRRDDRQGAREFDTVIELIAVDKLEEALTALKVKSQSAPQQLQNRVVMQSRRLTSTSQQYREGQLSRENADVERTRIAEALLGLVRELQESSEQPTGEPTVSNAEVLVAMRQLETGRAKSQVGPTRQVEAVHGINNLKSISWVEIGVRTSRSVCRILVPTSKGTRFGTGFLIASGRVMTNNHVIGSMDDARNAKIEFNYQLSPDAASTEPTVRYELDPDAFFKTSPFGELDYTVVAVRPDVNKPALEKWGTLVLNADAEPIAGELVAVIQHPNAQIKQIVLNSSAVVQTKVPFLHYSSDTMKGSSGSPVFNDLWQVVAIHHAEGPNINGIATNEGILMSSIRPSLGSNWPR